MSHWNPEQLLILLAVCVFLAVLLPKLGPSEKAPLDTKHDLHDLPEWDSLSLDASDKEDRR